MQSHDVGREGLRKIMGGVKCKAMMWGGAEKNEVGAKCKVAIGQRKIGGKEQNTKSWQDASLKGNIDYTVLREREREMFYLTTHSTHFIYGYMVSDIWLRTILIGRKETRCRHIDYSYRLTARVLLYAPSHRQDDTYHSLCYTSHGALAGTRNSSMGPSHEGSIR